MSSHQAKLRQWAERMIPDAKEGDKPEDGKVHSIRLASDTQVWDTWYSPFPSPGTWCDEVEALLDAQADQLPIRRHTLTFTAEDSAGKPIAQQLTSVQGKNKEANELGGHTAATKAIAEAIEGLTRTMNAILKSAETQVTSLTRTVESQAGQIHDMVELFKAKNEQAVAESEIGNQVGQMILSQVQELGGPLLELGKAYFESRGKVPGAALDRVASVITSNGKGAS
jgi:hypothetical protein